jgi:hypothetical protein
LRFTPDEFQHLWDACRGIDFRGDYFTGFKRYLVDCLAETAPELARLVARLRRQKLELLYRYVRERKRLCTLTAIFEARQR